MIYINKIKTLTNKFVSIESLQMMAIFIIILLLSLFKSYNYMNVALESIKLKQLTLEYVMARLANEMIEKILQ